MSYSFAAKPGQPIHVLAGMSEERQLRKRAAMDQSGPAQVTIWIVVPQLI
jgi:hypothetical protein